MSSIVGGGGWCWEQQGLWWCQQRRVGGVIEEKKIVDESRVWETVESKVSGGEKEKEKLSIHCIKLGVSIYHYISPGV